MSGSVKHSVSTAILNQNRQLKSGVKLALLQLNEWLKDTEDLHQLDLAFGSDWNRSQGLNLLQSWAIGEQLPEIEVVTAVEINGANGAFDSTTNRIYISQELLDRQQQQPDVFNAVFLEELGHYFDSQVNAQDSLGDEGAIFAKLVQGQQISSAELISLKQENDHTQVTINGSIHNLELNGTYGNITVDGNLADWTAVDRLDSAATGTAQVGYELYGKYNADNYLFAIKSAQIIGAGTTIWLNTDQNTATGYQIFGNRGGAEYNINFAADGKAYLYNGADGENYLAPLDYSLSADGLSAEIAVSASQLGTTAPTAIDVLADVNNQVFIPGNYATTAKLTVSQTGNSIPTFVPKNIYGNISLDGSLTDWTATDRLDYFASQQVAGYQVYGKNTADGYVLAINAAEAIGANTTIWLNTDQNKTTGYQVFGSTVGAEYNINIAANGTPYLYGGAAGETFLGQVDFALSTDGKTLEVAIPKSSIIANGTGIQAAIDINDRVFLPGDYASNSLSIDSSPLPVRTDLSKRVGIVYSETSANKFFDKKAYNQLFTAAQNQAIAAGVPFDILTESDLKDLGKIVNYDALVFPYFANVNKTDLNAIENTLNQAVAKYGIGIVTSGDFMTNDETGVALAGDPYSRMKNLLGIQRTAGGGVVNAIVTAKDVTNNILSPGYTTGEQLINYDKGTAFATYSAVGTPGTILAEQTVSGITYNAVVATKTGGQNVHFANQSIFADSKMVSQAIESIVYKDKVHVSLDLTRNNSLFLSRDDVDQSQYADEAPAIESKLGDVLTTWKSKYGFVGTHFINIGNNPAIGESTDWNVMKPIYQRWLALGNEIGTHSYTHPEFPSNLTPTQVEFEFNQSKNVISQQLGITVTGAATPGNPDSLALDQQIDGYFQYYTGVGTAYNNAFGFLDPTAKAVYFAPNISFDFNAIGFLKLTNAQTTELWNKEYNQLRSHSHKPIIEFAWHDYGPTGSDPLYDPAIYDKFIAQAAADGTEFVTFDDAQNRLRTFEKATVTIDQVGNVITANVTPDISTAGVGKFSLDIESTQQIKNVTNYYAFDRDSVFLTKNGGNYTINLGTATDNVTHIVALAQRAELLSVTGDGQNLDYSFNGEGKISIDLNIPTGKGVTATGADSYTLIGNRLEMNFNQMGTHTAKVILGNDLAPTIANSIADITVNETATTTSIDLTNVFKDLDTTTDVNQIVKSIQVAGNTGIATPTIVGNTLTLKYQPYAFGTSNITIRGTSGGKTVDDTFTITRKPSNFPTNVTPNLINGNASINIITGGATNNIIQGYAGNDFLTAGSKNDVLIGGTGHDTLIGGTGKDILVGVDPTSVTAGKGEIDTLTHVGQGDRFVLGDVNQVYYNDGISTNRGLNDYAKIVGFSAAAGDVIQLKGKASDYSLGTSPILLTFGTAIYNNTLGQPELIGLVQNVSGLNLTANYFNYV